MANPPYGPGQPGGWQHPGPQPYPPQTHPGYAPPAGPRYDNDKGFFSSHFDFSFDNFIATKLVKFLYVLLLIFISIGSIVNLVLGLVDLGNGDGGGLLRVILTPVLWLFGLAVARLYLELIIVMFKINKDLEEIRDRGAMR